MLILSRKIDEEIIINSNIKIKILSVGDNNVKIGLSAPSDVEILRGEIYERIKENTLDANLKSRQKITDITDLKLNKIK